MSVLKMKQDNQLEEHLRLFCENSDELASRRALGRALAALPDREPPVNGWRAIEGRLARRGRRSGRREPNWFLAGVGVAASVVLVVGLLVRQIAPEPPPNDPLAVEVPLQAPATGMDADNGGAIQVASLMRYSRQLEQQLRAVRARNGSRVLSGSEAATVDELERMIGVVDLQLAAAPTTEQERAALWRKRVNLMNQLLAAQVRPASMEL